MKNLKTIFLRTAALGILGTTLLLGADNLAKKPYETASSETLEQIEPKTKQKSSLEELAKTGLPQEFREMGFTVGDYVNRGTDKEVIILAENHMTANRENQVKFVKYLTEKCGVSSLGIESCTGQDTKISFPVQSDNSYKGFSLDFADSPEEKLAKIQKGFSDYKVSIPIYGIENDSLLKLVNILSLNRDKKRPELIRIIQNQKISENFRESDLQFNPNETLNWQNVNIKYWYNARNKTFGKEIQKYMEKNKSKVSAIIVGTLHADVPYELGYPKELDTLQEHLPYSNLVVYCGPGANPRQEHPTPLSQNSSNSKAK